VDKYDAIKHGHTANPGAQEQKAEQEVKKKQCVRRIHVISNILQDEMFEPCERVSRQEKKREEEASTQTSFERAG
jgi:hypothetical protein